MSDKTAIIGSGESVLAYAPHGQAFDRIRDRQVHSFRRKSRDLGAVLPEVIGLFK